MKLFIQIICAIAIYKCLRIIKYTIAYIFALAEWFLPTYDIWCNIEISEASQTATNVLVKQIIHNAMPLQNLQKDILRQTEDICDTEIP